MYIALNKDGERIEAIEASRDQEYYCQTCKAAVRLRRGSQRAAHFSHKEACSDTWRYEEMSEWHRAWQESFPVENREIVLNIDNEIHRADVLINNTVIEFQHSSMTRDDFYKRSRFYINNGYRVIWLFDEIEHFQQGRFIKEEKPSWKVGSDYYWKHGRDTFDGLLNYRDFSHNPISVFIQTDSKEDSSSGIMEVYNAVCRMLWITRELSIPEFIDLCKNTSSANVELNEITEETLETAPQEASSTGSGSSETWKTIQQLWDEQEQPSSIVVENQYGFKYLIKEDPRTQKKVYGNIQGYPPYRSGAFLNWSLFPQPINWWNYPFWKYSSLSGKK